MCNCKIIVFLLIFFSTIGFAQENEQKKDSISSNFVPVEIKANFPGGLIEFYKFYGQNFRTPEKAYRNKIKGTFYIEFIVESDGSVTNVEIIKDLGCGIGEEATRVLNSSPKWNPAMQNGTSVRSKCRMPMTVNYMMVNL